MYGCSYIDSTSALSSMDAFLGEKIHLDHIEYLRGVGKYREKGYPRRLPAKRERERACCSERSDAPAPAASA